MVATSATGDGSSQPRYVLRSTSQAHLFLHSPLRSSRRAPRHISTTRTHWPWCRAVRRADSGSRASTGAHPSACRREHASLLTGMERTGAGNREIKYHPNIFCFLNVRHSITDSRDEQNADQTCTIVSDLSLSNAPPSAVQTSSRARGCEN